MKAMQAWQNTKDKEGEELEEAVKEYKRLYALIPTSQEVKDKEEEDLDIEWEDLVRDTLRTTPAKVRFEDEVNDEWIDVPRDKFLREGCDCVLCAGECVIDEFVYVQKFWK